MEVPLEVAEAFSKAFNESLKKVMKEMEDILPKLHD